MRTFCTIFDKKYLYQGVALYNSLKRFAGDFKLYTLCMDTTAYATMMKIRAVDLIPINIVELINPETLPVRERTTDGQFCWVCQPLICQFILDKFHVDMVTYLEADSLFFSNPEVLFEELGEDSVLISPHNYSSQFDNSVLAGKFCTQFNTFRNNEAAREVLNFWKFWCFKYDRNMPSFYPGQICLDYWPELFNSVRIITNLGAGVAPWNIQRFRFEIINSVPHVDTLPIVFYHYHQYGRYKNGNHELGTYPLPKKVIDSVYKTYVRELHFVENFVREIDSAFFFRREYESNKSFMDLLHSFTLKDFHLWLSGISRRYRGKYNVFSDWYFLKDVAKVE